MSASTRTPAFAFVVEHRWAAYVVLTLGLVLSPLLTADHVAADPPPQATATSPDDCTGDGWQWDPSTRSCQDVGVLVDGAYKYNYSPGYGLVPCDSADAATYQDSEVGIPTGHTLLDGSPVCYAEETYEGARPLHPDTLREMLAPPPQPDAPAREPRPAPIPVGERLDLVHMGNGECGGKRQPRDLTPDDYHNRLGYLCDTAEGVWVLVQYERVAYEHEIDWYATGPCDRQRVGIDPFRDERVIMRNKAFSQEACDAWLLKVLSDEFARRKEAAGGGVPGPYCQVIGIGKDRGDVYAYGQVFLNAPDGNGNCVSTPVYWGSYQGALSFASTNSSCASEASDGAIGTSQRSVSWTSSWRVIVKGDPQALQHQLREAASVAIRTATNIRTTTTTPPTTTTTRRRPILRPRPALRLRPALRPQPALRRAPIPPTTPPRSTTRSLPSRATSPGRCRAPMTD